MDPKELLLLFVSLGLLGGLRLTSTTTTTTFVAAMSIANQDLERYFRPTNSSQSLTAMTEERIAMDLYTYAFLNYSYVSAQHPEPVFSTYTEEKARYGEGRLFNVRGKLVHITDDGHGTDYACSARISGTRGEPTPPAGVTWIALVRRGNCTFEEKVKNVHAKGAAGVIVYNDKQVTNLEKMQIKVKNRNITAVITFDYVGEEMARIVDQGNDMTAAIIEGRSGMRPINTLNRTSVLFVSISFIVLMIISLVWLIFYYIQRFRYLQTKDQQSRHLCSVTKKVIMKIPTKTGKMSDEKDADSDCCAICIEAYKPSDCIRVLPCKHEFHKNCIDPWLIEHRTCPMCKLDVLKFYGYVVGNQIISSPNPVHNPPTPNLPTPPGHDELDEVQVVPVAVVVAVATASSQTQTPPMQQSPEPAPASGISSSSSGSDSNSGSSSSSSSSSSNSSSSHAERTENSSSNSSGHCNDTSSNPGSGGPSAAGARSPSATHVVTASRQVTDV